MRKEGLREAESLPHHRKTEVPPGSLGTLLLGMARTAWAPPRSAPAPQPSCHTGDFSEVHTVLGARGPEPLRAETAANPRLRSCKQPCWRRVSAVHTRIRATGFVHVPEGWGLGPAHSAM